MDFTYRTELIIGKESIRKLQDAHVAIFGVGGVGGAALETLARAGVGHFTLVDNDIVTHSNFNRQLLANEGTYNKLKVEAGKERVLSINPHSEVKVYPLFYLPETQDQIDFSKFDYVIDALDTVTAKILIIRNAYARHIPVISAMGSGNRLDPSKVTLTDLSNTKDDPLARVVRKGLKKYGIIHVSVVCSTELPFFPYLDEENQKQEENNEYTFSNKKHVPGSSPFVPLEAGNLIAYKVMMDITGFDAEKKKKAQMLVKEKRHLKQK